MAGTRKLGKPTDQRLAMLKTLTTDVLLNGKVVTKLGTKVDQGVDVIEYDGRNREFCSRAGESAGCSTFESSV